MFFYDLISLTFYRSNFNYCLKKSDVLEYIILSYKYISLSDKVGVHCVMALVTYNDVFNLIEYKVFIKYGDKLLHLTRSEIFYLTSYFTSIRSLIQTIRTHQNL